MSNRLAVLYKKQLKIRFKAGAPQAQSFYRRSTQLHQPSLQAKSDANSSSRQSNRSQQKPKGSPTVLLILLHTVHPFLPCLVL